MAPKKRAARKRKAEEGLEAEQREASVQKHRRNKKYIGAHVGIQGKVCGHFSRVSLAELLHQPAVLLQGASGKLWRPAQP